MQLLTFKTQVKPLLYFIILGVVLSACSSGKGGSSDFLKPKAGGAVGEVIVVMDSLQWTGTLGNALREVFMKAVPGLPRPEPQFDLKHVQPQKLTTLIREARNIIYVTDLGSSSLANRRLKRNFTKEALAEFKKNERYYVIKRDEFAKEQHVLHLFGPNEGAIIENLSNDAQVWRDHFNTLEKERLTRDLFKGKENRSLAKLLLEKHNYFMRIPFGYQLAENSENFIWLRKPDPKRDKSVYVYYEPYTNESIFEDSALINLRNRIGKKYIVDVDDPNVYMTTETEVLYPEIITTSFSDKYAREIRGMWKLNDEYQGGTFLTYVFVDQALSRLYYIEGWVESPQFDKRDQVRELHAILHTFRTQQEYQGPNSGA